MPHFNFTIVFLIIGDIGSRSAGTLGEIRLFDAAGTMLAQQDLVYSGNVNGTVTYTETDNTGSMGSNNTLDQWGDDQTAFVGFSATTWQVDKVLIVVGDDDFGDDGNTEHLSFIGATIVKAVPEPTSCVALATIGLAGLARRRRR